MGIKGLHGLLKSIQKPCHLKKFSGQTLGVDAYGWLHRGTIACAADLVLETPTTKHIDFVLNRVRMLLHFGIKPYLVFDGDDLPSKSGTEQDRHQKRRESKALAMELQRKGRTAEAYQEFQRAVDVTPLMARQLIEELKKMDVQYVVAPYEADPQLVYLEQHGFIDGIISEDSDLLVFGAKRLISKLDQHGDCVEISRSDFTACREVSFVGWTDADFRRMCILSGCDYLANIPGIGLKTAYRSIRRHKNVEKALRMLQFDGQYRVPTDYLKSFRQAELTFLYQRVFCPKAGQLVTLTPPEEDVKLEDFTFIGDDLDPDTAVGVARGDLDPTTKQPLILKPLGTVQGTEHKPVPPLNRRQTIGSFSELKPSKPINTFFTPKRVPLAELDPNSLTPSPSQQWLLQHHANNSWVASPAPYQPASVRSAPGSGPSSRFSSPLVRSAERSSFLARASKLSNMQPVKRQRLCSETDETSPANAPACRSRFFSATSDDSSPSGQKVNRAKKVRKSALDVFSDDAAEEIMSQLPDPESAEKPERAHGKSDPCERSNSKASGLQSTVSTTTGDDTNVVQTEQTTALVGPSDTRSKTLSIDFNSEIFNEVLDYHINKQNSVTLSKYAFETPTSKTRLPKESPRRRPLPRVDSGRIGTSTRQKRLTPLQRLGQDVLARSRSMSSISASPSVWRTSKCETKADHRPKDASAAPNLGSGQGSEDLIVPDSEDEDEDEDECNRDSNASRPPRTSLDLKRFTFTSK